jgi:hypothetical protein
MKIYYINDRNHTFSDEEQEILNKLEAKHELKPIYIRRCDKSRYLCKKERIEKLHTDLKRVPQKNVIVFFNFINFGGSYKEILDLLSEHQNHKFFYICGSEADCPEGFERKQEDGFVVCRIHAVSIIMNSSVSEKFIKQQSILYGLQCTKKKPTGRKKGAVNKTSDYTPYHDKIAEMVSKGSSLITIVRYIGVGSKSGLNSYIKKNISNNQPHDVKILKPNRIAP